MKKYKVTVDGQSFTVLVEELTSHEKSPTEAKAAPAAPAAGPDRTVANPAAPPAEKAPEPQGGQAADAPAVNVESPMPGSIIDLAVKEGDAIKEGDVLLILEAMKMENEITAPQSGTVSAVHVKVGDTVGSGELLVEIS